VTREFVASAVGSPLAGLMALDDGKSRALYAVAEVPAEAGGRAFLLKKLGTDDGYRLECTHGGLPLSCECAGWVYRGACRHTAHVGGLVYAGRL
jgi:hypothetical protein